MLILFEISNPFQRKPGKFKSSFGWRFWWLWFAIAIYNVREDQLIERATFIHTKGGV